VDGADGGFTGLVLASHEGIVSDVFLKAALAVVVAIKHKVCLRHSNESKDEKPQLQTLHRSRDNKKNDELTRGTRLDTQFTTFVAIIRLCRLIHEKRVNRFRR
jgi:hypothetical protein